MSQNIIKRIDDMGSRIDELETSIADLMQQVCTCRQAAARNFCAFASALQAAPTEEADK